MDIARTLQRLEAGLAAALNLRGSGTATVTTGPQGMTVNVPPPIEQLAVITQNYGDGSYAWQAVYQTSFGQATSSIALQPHGASLLTGHEPATGTNFGGANTGDAITWVAYERQRRAYVPPGAFVWLKPHKYGGDLAQEWVFDYPTVAAENDLPWAVQTTLSGDITSTAAALAVADAGKFPSLNKFIIQIDDEQLCVGAPNTGTNAWSSLIRGWNSTLPAAHSSGAAVLLIQNSPDPDIGRLLMSMIFESYVADKGDLQGSVSTTTGNGVTPIVVTSTAHGLVVGDIVLLTGVQGNTAANGLFEIIAKTTDTFSLNQTGDGAYTTGGFWKQANTDPQGAIILNQTQIVSAESGPDADGFYSGYRFEYDPTGETLDQKEPVRGIDVNQF